MSRRLELQALLEELLGNRHVYFQPPASLKMEYDCIRYERDRMDPVHADNTLYQLHDRYQLTLIYKNPDSELPAKIAALPLCSHNRHYSEGNLHHDIFTIYY